MNIESAFSTNAKIIRWGPKYSDKKISYTCIEYDAIAKIIVIHTDHPDYYTMYGKLEEVIGTLGSKFNIEECNVKIIHIGEQGIDIDICLQLHPFVKSIIIKILAFIASNFFKNTENWIYTIEN